jgi:hypothetical protein
MPSMPISTKIDVPSPTVNGRLSVRRSEPTSPPEQKQDVVGVAPLPIQLTTAVVSTINFEPVVWVKPEHAPQVIDALPSDVFGDTCDAALKTLALEHVVRANILDKTRLVPSYFDQLATFLSPPMSDGRKGPHLTIGYIALIHSPLQLCQAKSDSKTQAGWVSIYSYLPWEDWREGRPDIIDTMIQPHLALWAGAGGDAETIRARQDQIRVCFGSACTWDDERVLDRYQLMQAADLFGDPEAQPLGRIMRDDHRQTLAAALGRLRVKLRYRPVVFELMGEDFTLFELQRTVEGIIGPHLHKQNFRRLVESMGLVEPTGDIKTHTGGRPAKLFRFRAGVVLEQHAPGMRVRVGHT